MQCSFRRGEGWGPSTMSQPIIGRKDKQEAKGIRAESVCTPIRTCAETPIVQTNSIITNNSFFISSSSCYFLFSVNPGQINRRGESCRHGMELYSDE